MMSRDDQRPLVDTSELPLLEEDEFNTTCAPSTFRRSKSTNFTCSNHGYELSSYDKEESDFDLRGSMRAASRKYQESVARLRSSLRGENKNSTVANSSGSNRFTYMRQNSSPASTASHSNNQWETNSVIIKNSLTMETSGYISNGSHNNRDFHSNSDGSRQSGFGSRNTTTPNSQGNSPAANDSGYYGNNTPVAMQNTSHSNDRSNDEKSRVTISRNSGQYADVTEHVTHLVTGVSSAPGHQEDITDGVSDEETDLLHSMTQRSPFRRSMPRRHSYHNLRNAYQSQAMFRQRQQQQQRLQTMQGQNQQNQDQVIQVRLTK